MIKISVIVPNYNHSKYLRQRLDSVIKQTYGDFEIIILDDCSQDNSREIIESYRGHPRVSHIIYNEKNSGSPFLQWAKGAGLAKGDWIWIAESDDFAEHSFLDAAILAINQYPSIGLFYCDSNVVNEGKEEYPERFSVKKNQVFNTTKWDHSYYNKGINEINECLKFDSTINNMSGIVFRKNILSDAAGFLGEFRYYGDWVLTLLAAFSGDVYYCNKQLSWYRKHDTSYLNSETSIVISRYEYFKILKLLYDANNVTGKKELLAHFVYHYLSFGLMQDGIKKAWRILSSYFKIDRRLALQVVIQMPGIKLSRKKRPFLFSK